MSSALGSSSPLIGKLIVYARLTLVLLIIVTVVLLIWQRFGMTRTYELTGREGALVRVEDDRNTTHDAPAPDQFRRWHDGSEQLAQLQGQRNCRRKG